MSDSLSAQHERLLKMVEEIEDYAIILLDKTGNIENWNKGAEKIKGYQAQEIIGKNFNIFYTEEDRLNELPKVLLGIATREGKAKHKGWRKRKDGSLFWGSILITALHDNDGNVIGFTKLTRDLTANKEAEESLHRYEERYVKMIAEVTDYAIILLDVDGNVENWNAGAERIKGYTASEILHKNFRIFYPLEDRKNGLPEKLIGEAIDKGRVQHEGWRLKKDGSSFWGMVTITALHNDKGEVIGFSKVTNDMTAKILAERKVQHYIEQLEVKNKELEQFSYITSHDLQEPLRTISNFAGLLVNEKQAAGERPAKFAAIIKNAADRMSILIKGLLDYSRIGTSKMPEEMNCTDIVHEVERDLNSLIKDKEAKISYSMLPVITGYKTEIYQLFQNLVGNAIKYHKKDVAPEVIINYEDLGSYWQFNICDNGIGMNPRYMHKIFLIFQRLHTRDEYEGSGIGLANCKKIVELHGGRIWAESEEGVGSKFSFTISKSLNK